MLRNLLIAASAAAMIGGMSLSAEAMPMSGGAPAVADAPAITLVAGGCGIGFHRGPYGGCRVNGPRFFGPRCVMRRGPYGGWRRYCR